MYKKVYRFIRYYNYRIEKIVSFISRNNHSNKFFLRFIVEFFRRRLIVKQNIFIGKDVIIGKNIKFPHPHGILFGTSVNIGDNCIIYHDVTIGQNKGKFPKIGNSVIIYPGVKIFGDILIGNNVIIGANSVVTKSIPDNTVFAGIPAKKIRCKGDIDEFY